VSFWDELDDDRSGRVDLIEFKHCVEPALRVKFGELKSHQVLPTWAKMTPSEKAANDVAKFISRMRDRIAGHAFGKQSSFGLDDLFKLIWLTASIADVKTMKIWFEEICLDVVRSRVIKTPPVLPPFQHKELCAVFEYYSDLDEFCSFDILVLSGLIDAEQAQQMRRIWDLKGDGMLDIVGFCEMMCPSGYRATRNSGVGSVDDGSRVVLDRGSGRWEFATNFVAVA